MGEASSIAGEKDVHILGLFSRMILLVLGAKPRRAAEF